MNTPIYDKAYANCQVNAAVKPVACSCDFDVADGDLAAAPPNVDKTVWAQAEATAGCRKKVQDASGKVAPCECKYDGDGKQMHCHCYDPDSLVPPKPLRPSY